VKNFIQILRQAAKHTWRVAACSCAGVPMSTSRTKTAGSLHALDTTARRHTIKVDCRFVLQLLLLGAVWDENAAEAVAMALQCGARVSACDSMGNTAIAAALSAASSSLSPQLHVGCAQFPFLELACLRLLRDGGPACIPRHSHIQIQRESDAPPEQLPLILTCMRLGWRKLTLELVNREVPLHPAKEILQALCR
jgi:hypothetical protein